MPAHAAMWSRTRRLLTIGFKECMHLTTEPSSSRYARNAGPERGTANFRARMQRVMCRSNGTLDLFVRVPSSAARRSDMPDKPILCLDFDGVIHSYTSGWKGVDVIPDPPVPGALDFIDKAREHFIVAIYSSRSGQIGGKHAMTEWLKFWMDSDWGHEKAWRVLADIEWPS